MTQIGERAELALELIDLFDVRIVDRLERDPLVALLVLGLVHDAHAARTDAPQDLISVRGGRFFDHPAEAERERGIVLATMFAGRNQP